MKTNDSNSIRLWRYTNSTEIIWCSFDCGEVEAYTEEEALKKAKIRIESDLKIVNILLKNIGYTIEMNLDEIDIVDITNEFKKV